jgi:hypothetical protein
MTRRGTLSGSGDEHADGQRDPGRLNALIDGRGAVSGPESPRGAARRAVREHAAEPSRDRECSASQGERRERRSPETAVSTKA